MKKIILFPFVLSAFFLSAQTSTRPDNWFNLDPATDKINGVGTERSYKELLKDKKSTTVIVGVLDSGVDFDHEDLKTVMWTNPGEIAGNGIDDDKNGYIDDVHGWNFIGGKDGKNIDTDNLEMTRLVRKLKPKYDGKTEADFTSKQEKTELKYYQTVYADYLANLNTYKGTYDKIKSSIEKCTTINTQAKEQLKVDKIGQAELEKYQTTDTALTRSIVKLSGYFKSGQISNLDELLVGMNDGYDYYKSFVEYNLNLDYDPRSIVGDDYSNSYEKYYGNADCNGPDSFHGTHVAGIIAAARSNSIGMDGVANNVRIMAVRCVPNGDERDKDVANAIRYAVDNGATILNMSFGKKYSWDKKVVDDAVKYAESKGVLLIHAAGNDHLNIDSVTHYPCKKFEGKGEASNFVDVGALSWKANEKMVAPFSNYGKKTVDVFSPGVEIYSTTPKNGYKDASGTSMAAPVTAGVAAVIKSYFPDLTAKQIKKILVKSSLKTYSEQKVIKPGTKNILIEFDDLSKNGGIVSLYEAIKMAEKYSKIKP